MNKSRTFALLLFAALAMMPVSLVRAADPSGEEIVKRALDAFYYVGADMRAKVKMRLINPQGSSRERELTMLRLNLGSGGDQRYYMYFHGPADVRGTTFMVWKHPVKEDDRWIYVPAVKLVKRIAADDKRSSFVGSDFTYEDISGREVDDEVHRLLRSEEHGGRPAYVVESTPKVAVDYVRRLSWIDKERWLPLKEEYFDVRGELVRVFTADMVEQKGGHWTITARTMKNLQSGHRTEVTYSEAEYDVGLKEDVFTERYLRDAPKAWIR